MAGPRKWFNMFPYSNYQIYNLDYLLQKYGEQDERIKKVEEKNDEQDVRLDADEADIDQLQLDMDNAEEDISDLKTRMQTAEDDIDSLEGRMDTAEGKISDLETLTSGDHDDIVDLKPRVAQAELDIDSLEGRMDAVELKNGQQDNDIIGLDSRVTDLENESAVIANPGGTGANLNTISIDNVTYVIPSGGGGGGGSSVTPNPAGSPTQTLDKVDIDGTIYGMPITSAEVTALNGDISDIQGDISDIQDAMVSALERTAHNSVYINDVMCTGSVQDSGAYIEITEPGVYLVNAYVTEFDTSNYGSTPRNLGLYIRDESNNNHALAKAYINGSEEPMITQAMDMNINRIMFVDDHMAESPSLRKLHVYYRVNASVNRKISTVATINAVRLCDYVTTP